MVEVNYLDTLLNRHIIRVNFILNYIDIEFAMSENQVQKIRESLLMSKAELARKAGLSPLTIDRIEKGASCRLATKRKIILALGLDIADRDKVFP